MEHAKPWLLTSVYAPPYTRQKKLFWDGLAEMANSMKDPWLIIGDVNEVMSPDEKCGVVESWVAALVLI